MKERKRIEMNTEYQFTGFEYKRASVEVNTMTPENKRDIPCDGCPLAATCAANYTECSAFRNWASTGDYKDADVQRLIRASK